jgi:hypothetical protein
MCRFLFVLLLVWPFLLPPGICACSLTEADWFSDDTSTTPTDSHDEDGHGDHCDDCPGAKKLFLSRTTPETADALTSFVAPLIVSAPSAIPESVPTDCQSTLPFRSGPFYILLCSLLN